MTIILVIENDVQVRTFFSESLKQEGFEVIEAENGRIGVREAQKYQPDLIACNIIIPELNGDRVLKTLRANPATAIIPFIFLTDKDDRSTVRRGMELGADDCLVKPFTAAEFSGAIAAQLKKRSLFQQWFPFQFQPVSSQIGAESDLNIGEDRFHYCPQLKEVFDFIEAHYHEAISLRHVANKVGFSPTYLTELVKRKTGKTVNRWIIERRLTAACSLLLETTNSIESVAESVGYNNLTHFFNQFRKHYQTTPKVWRQTYR